MEPNLSPDIQCALYAPTSAIVCPYELTIAAVGNAIDNGAELKRNFEVSSVVRKNGIYTISSCDDIIYAKTVINAAGIYSDKISDMVGDGSFNIIPRRGEYILLDKNCGKMVSRTIFRTPTSMGKGILVSPTVDGNLLTGPTSFNINDKEDKATTAKGLAKIKEEAAENIPSLSYSDTISSFCGLRAVGNTGDFIINSPFEGFINVAGIESPGLSASPAIALKVLELLKAIGTELEKRDDYDPIRESAYKFRDADIKSKNEMIKLNPSYGKIICRCEGVSEGEIIDAIRREPVPFDLDGIKRRTRAQMGRCQGGFCTPYIIKLLAKERGIPYEDISKFGKGSELIVGKTKGEL